ncbi:hypothetical protein N657DRAFT_649019 [Parathielavia appendiculata]|uniref:Uncharacterized protein n=1 Tax=Parathielavia appendiculata TaxID=2587402 RepID=A0AAN6TUQ2_9PEZI|nr:hypothetical protein N657DRAFT_649019 [Parathielavia appendiculata]
MKLELDQDSGLGCLRMSLSFWNKNVLSNPPRGITPYIETVCHDMRFMSGTGSL